MRSAVVVITLSAGPIVASLAIACGSSSSNVQGFGLVDGAGEDSGSGGGSDSSGSGGSSGGGQYEGGADASLCCFSSSTTGSSSSGGPQAPYVCPPPDAGEGVCGSSIGSSCNSPGYQGKVVACPASVAGLCCNYVAEEIVDSGIMYPQYHSPPCDWASCPMPSSGTCSIYTSAGLGQPYLIPGNIIPCPPCGDAGGCASVYPEMGAGGSCICPSGTTCAASAMSCSNCWPGVCL